MEPGFWPVFLAEGAGNADRGYLSCIASLVGKAIKQFSVYHSHVDNANTPLGKDKVCGREKTVASTQ